MNAEDGYIEQLTDREMDILRLKVERYSNQHIADTLYLSRNTVRWYVGQIYSKLDVGNRRELIQRVEQLQLLEIHQSSEVSTQTFLPKRLTSFIGRKQEIHDICNRLAHTRLLTLTGTGGTGKTRLALEVADQLHDDFSDGIYFVDLAPLSDASLVAKSIAETLGLVAIETESVETTLRRVLKTRQTLLVLDNFEHVLSAASLVADLLQATSTLTVLVTSREILHVYGEHEYAVAPLDLPDVNQTHATDMLIQYEAVQLFIQRAKAISRQFTVNDTHLKGIVEICHRLDGLPLAIELAAARSKILTPQAILDRLDNRLDVLTIGASNLPLRQQTLRNLITWSYDLLDNEEKTLFARLAVFRGGRSIEACEGVCGNGLSMDILDGLASLVDKNLLIQREDSTGEPRFWMLETIQEYAIECLNASGQIVFIKTQHSQYFMHWAETIQPELRTSRQSYWFQRLEIEHENIRTALTWTLQDAKHPEIGIRLINALADFWWYSTHQVEGDHWVHLAYEYIDNVEPIHQGYLSFVMGYFYWRLRRDHLTTRNYVTNSLDIARRIGDERLEAIALRYMGGCILGSPQELQEQLPVDEALDYVERSVSLLREIGDLGQLAHSLNTLGLLHEFNNNYEQAKICYTECIDIAQRIGDKYRTLMNLLNLGNIARAQGDHDITITLARKSLLLAREINAQFMVAHAVVAIVNPYRKPLKITRILAAADAALQKIGTLRQPSDQDNFHNLVSIAHDQLSDKDFQQAWDEGSAMTLDEAVAYALDEIDPF